MAPPMSDATALSYADPATTAGTRHPRAFWFFFWGEFAERCSYYGMRAILPLYLTAALHFADTKAGPIYYWFKMACYFLPLLGGYLADRVFGKYWTIVGFSVPYVLGHFILGIGTETSLFIGLALLAGGSGVTKPNISTLMGQTYDAQRPGQEQLRAAAFLWFYFAINMGALISSVGVPIIRNHHGYRIAFQFPAWIMVAALIVFAAGKRHYAPDPPISRAPLTEEQRHLRGQALARLYGVFFLFIFFFVGYEHNDSIWVFFARDYVNLHLPLVDKTIAPDQLQFINPLCVAIFVPLFGWLFRRLDPDAGVITAPRKIFTGFLFAASAPALLALASLLVRQGGKVSVAWVILAYVLLTLGEVLLYGTGLELAYAAAPKGMKSFVTACFLLTITLGNFVNVWFSPLYGGSLTDPADRRGPLAPAPFFALTAALTLAAAIAFLFVGRRLTARSEAV
jgi:POT family proton-dependent oligopeptide transporter